eukprot:tig00020592_g11637.t1
MEMASFAATAPAPGRAGSAHRGAQLTLRGDAAACVRSRPACAVGGSAANRHPSDRAALRSEFVGESLARRDARSAFARPAALVVLAAGAAGAAGSRPQHVRFRPCIDLHKGKVVQIVGSTLKDEEEGAPGPEVNFETARDSADFARMYRDDGLAGGHIIMLGPGNEEAATSALSAWPGGMQVGGGINPQNAQRYLDAGASHVIVTSYVFRDGKIDRERLAEMVAAVGPQRLVLDLSCRRKGDTYVVCTDRWQKETEFDVSPATLAELAESCDEFLIHAVDVEGRSAHAAQGGVLEDLIEKLGEWSPLPVTYCGGARCVEDLETVRRLGRGRVDCTIGSALDIFGGSLPYADVVTWQERQRAAARP